jgi:oligo-alginate lyase
MDHNKQSRYAQEFAPSYQGKIVNAIWETGDVTRQAQSYDRLFSAISGDGQFAPDDGKDSPLYGRSNADIRRNIEQNLLGDAVKAVYAGKIRGNYGMHQQTLATLALVLQDEETSKRARDFILNNSGESFDTEGFNFAMNNMVLREGMSFESAPGYCLIWSNCLSNAGVLLDKMGADIFSDPKFKRMFTIYMQLGILGRFGPTIGDTGSVTDSGMNNMSGGMARLAFERFKDPVFARYLLDRRLYGESTLGVYDSLKKPVLDAKTLRKAAAHAPDLSSGSRNLGGYGLGILEAGSGDRKLGLASYYGPTRGGHSHADKLFFELYAFGKKLIPDLGYPQFAAEYKGRTAWESNTISHTTVTVNGAQQSTYSRGKLNQFAVSPDVKLLDMSAPAVYPDAVQDYRRVMLMVGGEAESPYVVDFFIVKGGHSHDYSLHGFDGQFTTEGIDLKAQSKGTLAGEDVPYSYLYDDPELEKPDKTRSFGSYRGSGYSYLYNVRHGVPTGSWSAVWQDKDSGIRAVFPGQSINEAVIADGNPPRRPGNPESLKYVLLRSSDGRASVLTSRFACVLQPFKPGDPAIRAKRLPVESGDLLEITGPHGTDYVYLADDPAKTVHVGGLTITGGCAVLRMGPTGALRSAFVSGGGSIHQGMLSLESAPSLTGTVTAVNYKTNELDLSAISHSALRVSHLGTILFGESNYRIHTASIANGRLKIGLGDDSPRIGKLAVEDIDPDGKFITTQSLMPFAVSHCYDNRWLVNESHTAWHRVWEVSGGKVMLKESANLKSEFTDADGDGHATAYLYDIAPGQEFTIPATCWLGKDSSGKWRVESNTPAKVSLPDGTDLR